MFNYFETREASEDEEEDCGGWTQSQSSYSSAQKKKGSKRDQERAQLTAAFLQVQQDGKADLIALADAMDKSKKQIKNLVAEYGGYEIKGNTVISKGGEDLEELPMNEPVPFR